MTFQTPFVPVSLTVAAIFACGMSLTALGESKTSENAQALIQEVKKRDLEREIAAKQTEVNRLNEDLSKERGVAEDLKRSIEGIGLAIEESSSNLEKLSAERARLAQALEVATLRVEAEKLKVAGLKMLSEGQGKVLNYVSSRIEATERKAEIASAELKVVNWREPLPVEEVILDNSNPATQQQASGGESLSKLKAQIAELKRKGTKSQTVLTEASQAADVAIEAASAKLAQADAAAAKANKRAEELGFSETAEKSEDKDAITAPKATPVR
jgi:hypothetical protein